MERPIACAQKCQQSGDDVTDIVQPVICIAQRVIRTDQGGKIRQGAAVETDALDSPRREA